MKRKRAAPARPTHLVLTVNRQTLELRVVQSVPEAEADAAYAHFAAAFANTPTDVHLVRIPVDRGFVTGEVRTSQGADGVASTVARVGGVRIEPYELAKVEIAKPVPFRRQSPAEFEAETIAMMNGEASMEGMKFRDADAPLSEGGAMGL